MKKLLLFFLSICIGFSVIAQTNTWIGADGGLWEEATNWSEGVVPTTGQRVIINDDNDNPLTITGTAPNAVQGLLIAGTMTVVTLDLDLDLISDALNINTIQLAVGNSLILGNGTDARTFTTTTTVANKSGVLLQSASTNLTVAANSTLNVGANTREGIRLTNADATITNNGTINIVDYTDNGISQTNGTFDNNGIITINAGAAPATAGSVSGIVLLTNGTFNNNAGASISIENALDDAIDVTGSFNNAGIINATAQDAAASTNNSLSIQNGGVFTNMSGGVLNADGGISATGRAIYLYSGATLDNSGEINVSNGNPSQGIFSEGTVNNNVCAALNLNTTRVYARAGMLTNDGFMTSSHTGTALRYVDAILVNNGFFVYDNSTTWAAVAGAAPTGTSTDNGVNIDSDGTFTVDAANTCTVADIGIDVAHTWYSDAAGTVEVGANDAAGALTLTNANLGTQVYYTCYGDALTMTVNNVGDCVTITCDNTWTGADGGLWEEATNWSTGVVPAVEELVCIGGALTITGTAPNAVGGIYIEGEATTAVILDLDLTLSATAIENIQLSAGASLQLGNGTDARTFDISTMGASNYGVLANRPCDFIVAANSTLNIGTAFIGIQLANAMGTVTNDGTINIMDYAEDGIQQTDGVFDNNGMISINAGAVGSVNGINIPETAATFNNNTNATITIVDALDDAIEIGGTFNNAGTLSATAQAAGGATNNAISLATNGTLTNMSTGILNADGGLSEGPRAIYTYPSSTLDNSGRINISNGNPTQALFTRGTVNNNACAVINLIEVGAYFRSGTATNDGLILSSLTTSNGAIYLNATATNNGFFAYANNSTDWALEASADPAGMAIDNGVAIVDGTFTVDALSTCGVADIGVDVAHTWYSDVAGTMEAGTSDVAGALTLTTAMMGTNVFYSCYGDAFTMTVENVDGACTPLAAELIAFDGINQEKQIDLVWKTASENNNLGFEIERAYATTVQDTRDLEWKTLDFVVGHGTTTEAQVYTYSDIQPMNGINYYRLKQVDFNDTYKYSAVLPIQHGTAKDESLNVFPNPAKEVLNIVNGQGQVTVYNVIGQPVKIVEINSLNTQIIVSDLSNGQYILHFQKENGESVLQQFVKKD